MHQPQMSVWACAFPSQPLDLLCVLHITPLARSLESHSESVWMHSFSVLCTLSTVCNCTPPVHQSMPYSPLWSLQWNPRKGYCPLSLRLGKLSVFAVYPLEESYRSIACKGTHTTCSFVQALFPALIITVESVERLLCFDHMSGNWVCLVYNPLEESKWWNSSAASIYWLMIQQLDKGGWWTWICISYKAVYF